MSSHPTLYTCDIWSYPTFVGLSLPSFQWYQPWLLQTAFYVYERPRTAYLDLEIDHTCMNGNEYRSDQVRKGTYLNGFFNKKRYVCWAVYVMLKRISTFYCQSNPHLHIVSCPGLEIKLCVTFHWGQYLSINRLVILTSKHKGRAADRVLMIDFSAGKCYPNIIHTNNTNIIQYKYKYKYK